MTMQETPREARKRVYREATKRIREYSAFPYVAYTEHLSTVASPPHTT